MMAGGFRSITSNLSIPRRLIGDRASSSRVIRSLFTVSGSRILRTHNERSLLKNDLKNETSKSSGLSRWSSSSPSRATGLDLVSPLIGLTGTK